MIRIGKVERRLLHTTVTPVLLPHGDRRDVRTLRALQDLTVPHLASLVLPPPAAAKDTGTALSNQVLVEASRSRSIPRLSTFMTNAEI